MTENRLQTAFVAIDAANSADPNMEKAEGADQPKELLYGQRMSACLDQLAPDAPETVRLAVRAQHIERWKMPRGDYPEGKKGYHRWRTDLGRYHAERTAEIMAAAGYGEDEIARVKDILQKKKLRSDPDVQLMEDVICLVFLEYYFEDFAAKHPEEKIIDILRKTWAKMSPRGHEAALALDLPTASRKLVEKALAA